MKAGCHHIGIDGIATWRLDAINSPAKTNYPPKAGFRNAIEKEVGLF